MTPPRSTRSSAAGPGRSRVERRPARTRVPAEHLSVARVAVDVPLAHLDRPFDYRVSAAHDADARPGVRVRVRFAGRLVDGYVLGRVGESDHPGRLAYLERVLSTEPVLTAEMAELCRAVADRYAGTLADVLRLAIPPRHARAETSPSGRDGGARTSEDAEAPARTGRPSPEDPVIPAGWARYEAGAAFVAAVAARRAARAVWQALPGEDWAARLAEAAAVARAAGHGALMVVPDARDLAGLQQALAALLPPESFTVLTADLGPAERYRRFLAIRRGEVPVVAGTRAAAFAPVRDPALLAIFDDGDDLHAEPRAPYPHVREVLMMRSARQRSALLVAGFARTAEGQLLVESGWAASIHADRGTVRRAMPGFAAAGDESAHDADSGAARARLSPAAFAAARRALDAGRPVLVQVPRRGYVAGFSCDECRRPARCRRCAGPLALDRGGLAAVCRWCGTRAPGWACTACGCRRVRATVVGSARTAEEIGRAFPGIRLRTSAGAHVLDTVPGEPALVVATPGAEPPAAGGYGAALLLDGALLLGRADLRATEETFRRWMAAATLVRPGGDGGRVVIGADAELPTVRALLRWQPIDHARVELSARRELRFPPAAAMASLRGDEATVMAAIAELALPEEAEVLGPVPVEGAASAGSAVDTASGTAGGREARVGGTGNTNAVRALLRLPAEHRKDLATALRVLAAARSARKDPEPLRIDVDPIEVG